MDAVLSARDSGDSVDASPNWEAVQHEILCPLCDYNLRGLTQPRCPECGYAFIWAEVMDPARWEHRYLIEGPSRGLIGAFCKTNAAGWLPGAFWRGIHPSLPVNPPRLVVYWLFVSFPFVVAMALKAMVLAVYLSLQGFSMIQALRFRSFYCPTLAILLWPVALFLTLMIFQVSMRRAGIKPRHVVRCVAYCGGSLFAFSSVSCILAGWEWFYEVDPTSFTIAGPASGIWLKWTMLVWLGLSTWSLTQAYRHYLRLDHPFATAATSQFIVLLLAIILQFRLG